MNRKRTFIIVSAVTWMTWISGIFGNSGLIQAYKLSKVRHDMSLRVRALENQRTELGSTLHALEHDPQVQERTIRESLGFVRSSELVFEIR